jgi:hypothetical protein
MQSGIEAGKVRPLAKPDGKTIAQIDRKIAHPKLLLAHRFVAEGAR